MPVYLAFTKCADCNVQIQVHAYDLNEANTKLIEAISAHMNAAHYEGEPVAFAATLMVQAGV